MRKHGVDRNAMLKGVHQAELLDGERAGRKKEFDLVHKVSYGLDAGNHNHVGIAKRVRCKRCYEECLLSLRVAFAVNNSLDLFHEM